MVLPFAASASDLPTIISPTFHPALTTVARSNRQKADPIKQGHAISHAQLIDMASVALIHMIHNRMNTMIECDNCRTARTRVALIVWASERSLEVVSIEGIQRGA